MNNRRPVLQGISGIMLSSALLAGCSDDGNDSTDPDPDPILFGDRGMSVYDVSTEAVTYGRVLGGSLYAIDGKIHTANTASYTGNPGSKALTVVSTSPTPPADATFSLTQIRNKYRDPASLEFQVAAGDSIRTIHAEHHKLRGRGVDPTPDSKFAEIVDLRLPDNDDNEAVYISTGFWIDYPGYVIIDTTNVTFIERVGTFVHADEVLEGIDVTDLTGTATYSGIAFGSFHGEDIVERVQSPRVASGSFTASATLEANFDTSMIGGTISDIELSGNQFDRGLGIHLGDVVAPDGLEFHLHGNGSPETAIDPKTGRTALLIGGVGVSTGEETTSAVGSWGARFSDQLYDDKPRLVAGSFGAKYTQSGTRDWAYIGSFFAGQEEWLSDDAIVMPEYD